MSEDRREGEESKKEQEETVRLDNVSERWEQWLTSSGQVPAEDAEPRTFWRRLVWIWRTRMAGWNSARQSSSVAKRLERQEAREERGLERRERARMRREEREAARLAAHEERQVSHAGVARVVSDAKASVAQFRENGPIAALGGLMARKKVLIASVCLLMALSGFCGALLMRARHRRYLTGTLVAVNGVVIKRSELNDELYTRHGAATLQTLVDRELRAQFVRAHKAAATDEQVEARFKLEAQMPDFFATLSGVGASETDYRGSLRRVLGEINLMTKGVDVSEAEVRAFYRRNINPANPRALFFTPPEVTLAVVATPNADIANRALSELKSGRPFGEVAARHSIHETGPRGGVVPPYALGRSFTAAVTGLDAIARGLDEGRQTGPVNRNGVWWIVRCIARKPAVTRKYEDVKETAKLFALVEKGVPKNKQRLDAEFQEFRKKANVQRFAVR